MPRSSILGVGKLTVLMSGQGAITEMYYPGPGHANHLQDGGIRFAVWRHGVLHWLDSQEWVRRIEYDSEKNQIRWSFDGPLPLECCCTIGDDEWTMAWTASEETRLFVYARFNIDESDIGNTAMWVEQLRSLVHFKDRFGFEIRGDDASPILDWACGLCGFGAEGTWRDAEDGELSRNSIAQGSVDSTCRLDLAADRTTLLKIRALEKPFAPTPFFKRPRSESSEKAPSFDFDRELPSLPNSIRSLCRASESVIRAHIDRGAVPVASLDRDVMSTNRAHYAHCWMRDACHTVDLLDDMGDPGPAIGFLRFCATVIEPDTPYYLQKYTVDGDLASSWHPWLADQLPIQLDETAWVVKLASKLLSGGHIDQDLALNRVLRPSALWLAEFVDASGLPKPSWDLWEERCDVAASTVCVVISALVDASRALETVERSTSERLRAASDAMYDSFASKLIDANRHTVHRRLSGDDVVDAGSLYAILLGVVDPLGPVADATIEQVRVALTVREGIGGIARYEGDYYFRRYDHLPGNPWLICTMWLAQCLLARAREKSDLLEPLNWLEWAVERASGSQVLAEQYEPLTGEPLAVAPLAWSHVEFLRTALLYESTAQRIEA